MTTFAAFFSFVFFLCSDKYLSRLFHIVELVKGAQDILNCSTDMQAIINEAADLAKAITDLKAAHAKELEERDLNHATEVSKLSKQLENLGNNLAEAMKNAATTSTQQNQALQAAEDKLAAQSDEITAIHEQVLGKLPLFRLAFEYFASLYCHL